MSPETKNENMGGIFQPGFLFADQVNNTFVEQITTSLYVVSAEKWCPFPDGRTEISVQPQDDTLYDVTCSIRIPLPNVTDEFRLLVRQMKMRPVIIHYKQSDGVYRVIGSKLNPLSLTVEEPVPQVRGFNGMILTFAGVQPHAQLLCRHF
jgi:hypothetical protein